MKLVEFFVFVFCQSGFLPLDLGEVGFSAVCFLVGAVTSVMVDFLALAVSRRCRSISACCSSLVLAATGERISMFEGMHKVTLKMDVALSLLLWFL